MKQIYAAVVALFTLNSASLAQSLTFICEEPQGQRVEYGAKTDLEGNSIQKMSDGPIWSEDGYSNMRAIFVLKQETPDEVLVTWGHTIPDELVGILIQDTTATPAVVVYKTEDEIGAATMSLCCSGMHQDALFTVSQNRNNAS